MSNKMMLETLENLKNDDENPSTLMKISTCLSVVAVMGLMGESQKDLLDCIDILRDFVVDEIEEDEDKLDNN